MPPSLPDSYQALSLPSLLLSHHPATSKTVTPIIIIHLHRPTARNGITFPMLDSLIHAYTLLAHDRRVRAIVLTSSDKTNAFFSPGMDLNAYASSDPLPALAADYRDGAGRFVLAMYNCPKPTIAAINSTAVGGAITITLAADVRVVSRDAKIGFVFPRRGLTMEGCSSYFLPRLIGASKASHLLATGAVYPATHRLLDSLFGEIVAPDDVLPTALRIAEDIADNVSALAARVNKDLIFRGPDNPEAAHLLESRMFHGLADGKDSGEGVTSFLEKRKPNFQASVDEDAPGAYPWWAPLDVSVKSKI